MLFLGQVSVSACRMYKVAYHHRCDTVTQAREVRYCMWLGITAVEQPPAAHVALGCGKNWPCGPTTAGLQASACIVAVASALLTCQGFLLVLIGL